MAVATPDSYTSAGLAVYAGRPGPAEYWLDMPVLSLPTRGAAGVIVNRGTSVLNDACSDSGEQTQMPKVLGAWGGAVIVKLFNRYGDLADLRYMVFGGGHSDSGNDGVYCHSRASLAFSRLLAPLNSTPVAPSDSTYGENADGRPTSAHAYCHQFALHSDETGGPAMVENRAGGLGNSAITCGQGHKFALVDGTWARYGSLESATSKTVHVTMHDRTRGRVVSLKSDNGNTVYSRDIATAVMTTTTQTTGSRASAGWGDNYYACGVHHPGKDLFVASNWTGANPLHAMDATSLTNPWVQLTTTGDALPTAMSGVGLQYRSSAGSLIVIDMRDAVPSGYFEITPPVSSPLTNAWTVARKSFSGEACALEIYSGVKSINDRFVYVEETDSLHLCPSATAPMQEIYL